MLISRQNRLKGKLGSSHHHFAGALTRVDRNLRSRVSKQPGVVFMSVRQQDGIRLWTVYEESRNLGKNS